jgi:hypothetical protein
VKVTEKQCFDDLGAGCNLTYRADLEYVGPAGTVPDGDYDVTFEVRGGEGGPITDTFSISGGRYDPVENFASTTSAAKKLTAVVVDVSES